MSDTYQEVEFVVEIVRRLLGLPAEDFTENTDYRFNRTMDEKGVLIELFLRNDMLAPIIGKGGVTVNAIRELLRSLGARTNARYSLKLDRL